LPIVGVEENAGGQKSRVRVCLWITVTKDGLKIGLNMGCFGSCCGQIVGCLAGSTPHMVSAAVVGLARLLYEFSAELGHTIPDLLPSALLLLRTKSREIIKVRT
jgi:hypothetical protein